MFFCLGKLSTMLKFGPALLGLVIIANPAEALAHELWIDPAKFQLVHNDKLVADIKVGQNFKGNRQSYFPENFIRFDVARGDEIKPVEGRLGDRPAANIDPLGDGLNVLIYQSDVLKVYYNEWAKFVSFAEHKDFKDVETRHVQRGIPKDERFTEVYARYAKSLIAVGEGKGKDRVFGLETEIVALENPYTGMMDDGLDISVLYKGQPRTNAQVEVFERSPVTDQEVRVFTTLTDEDGVATIDVKPGYSYQLDAVVLREPDPVLFEGAAWETLWANLTLAIPATDE